MEDMKARGTAIILITHDLSDILDITDKIAVLRQGRLWAYSESSSTTQNKIIGWITGVLPSQIQEDGDLT